MLTMSAVFIFCGLFAATSDATTFSYAATQQRHANTRLFSVRQIKPENPSSRLRGLGDSPGDGDHSWPI